jgi:hypothetical protein
MSTTMTVVEELAANGFVDPKRHAEYMFGIEQPPVSWNDAARRCVYAIIQSSFKTWNRVSDLREYIDYLIEEMGPESKKQMPAISAAEYWSIFGSSAAATAEKLGYFDNIEQTAPELINQITDILAGKQRDYGHQNIARFGRSGLLVRAHDKVARLENLLGAGKVPANETVMDNFIDVIGYSAIGMMWEKGWFLLPLEPSEK